MEAAETEEPKLKEEQAALQAAQKAGMEHFKAAEQEHKAGLAQIAKNAETSAGSVAVPSPPNWKIWCSQWPLAKSRLHASCRTAWNCTASLTATNRPQSRFSRSRLRSKKHC